MDVIDQRALPHVLVRMPLASLDDVERAIREMAVRGAPLIGVAAAYGVAFALREDASDAGLARAREVLVATRPTAVNLRALVDDVIAHVRPVSPRERAQAAFARAGQLAAEDVAACRRIAEHGLRLVEEAAPPGRPVQILTHCNAGWLATVDWGTALAPLFLAHDRGRALHVWVSETRPRVQGALTAWELGAHGVPCTVVADNAAGLLVARGQVDLVIVGADRVTARGDVVNKVGTYLKALAAHAAVVPFYVAAPASTVDLGIAAGSEVPIEERREDEVTHARGPDRAVPLFAPGTRAYNPAFDVTPAALVTALVTDRGVVPARADAIAATFGPGPA